VPQIVSPLRFKNQPLQFQDAPPLLGQHTGTVLSELGFSEDQIQKLRDLQII
jgi:Predicted acyl-CoA transferases/carnitine dehydratase